MFSLLRLWLVKGWRQKERDKRISYGWSALSSVQSGIPSGNRASKGWEINYHALECFVCLFELLTAHVNVNPIHKYLV